MLVQFDLKGSKCNHKGIFDTNGFWAKFEEDVEELPFTTQNFVNGYKIYSHFSFAYYHEDIAIANLVYQGLLGALSGIDWNDPQIGFIREVC